MKKKTGQFILLCISIFSFTCTKNTETLPEIYQFIIYEKDLPGWDQSFGERGFAIVEGVTFYDIINGGAEPYIEHNYKKAIMQQLNDTSGKTLILIAVEFENEAAAEKMFFDSKEDGVDYVKIGSYDLTQTRGYLFADGIAVSAVYKNIYFVIQLSGYNDSTASIAEGKSILELLFRKGDK